MPFINGTGPTPAIGMILGEAPGYEETRQGLPFVGASGRLLNHALEEAGGSRADYYITNVYKERPFNNATPTQEQVLEHERYLRGEFDAVRPLYVLALGNVALRSTTGARRISVERGRWVDLRPAYSVEGTRVMPTWHPAYVLRNAAGAREQFFADVHEFVDKTRIWQ